MAKYNVVIKYNDGYSETVTFDGIKKQQDARKKANRYIIDNNKVGKVESITKIK